MSEGSCQVNDGRDRLLVFLVERREMCATDPLWMCLATYVRSVKFRKRTCTADDEEYISEASRRKWRGKLDFVDKPEEERPTDGDGPRQAKLLVVCLPWH